MSSQQSNNTTSLVTRVQKALSSQYTTVRKIAETEALPPPANNASLLAVYSAVTQLAGSDPTGARTRALWVKLRLRQAFPMNFYEATTPITVGTAALPSFYANKLPAGLTLSATSPAAYESSVCLLLALQRTVKGGVPAAEISQLSAQSFPAGTGMVTGLVDSLGTPLAFCRWPYGFTNLNPGGAPQAGFNDPEDPQGTLTDPNWVPAAVQTGVFTLPATTSNYALSLIHPIQSGASYKLQPCVVSAGPDMLLGLDLISFYQLTTDANDNISVTLSP